MTNSKVKGFLIERDGRELFMKQVEVVELTDVVSHSPIECRSKLIVIGDSCKVLLQPSE